MIMAQLDQKLGILGTIVAVFVTGIVGLGVLARIALGFAMGGLLGGLALTGVIGFGVIKILTEKN